MSSALRSAVVFAFVSAFAIVVVPGCSQQGEGERCDSAKNGDLDCDDGLTCTKKSELIEGITDRCCPAEGTESDKRCTHGVPTVAQPTAGTSSGGTSTGGTSTGGTDNGGAGTGAESAGGGDSAGASGDAAGTGGAG